MPSNIAKKGSQWKLQASGVRQEQDPCEIPVSWRKARLAGHREAALEEDNLQWTGPNKLFSADEIIRIDALDRLENNNIAWIVNGRTFWPCV